MTNYFKAPTGIMIIKKIFPIMGMAAAVAAAGLTGCSEERAVAVGEGTLFLSARVNSDVKVESRSAEEDDLAASTIVWISNADGVVRKFNGIGEVPSEGVKLLSGDYTVKAWAGKLEYASFTSRWFEGREEVSLSAGDRKSVEVVCRIANVVSSVAYADGIDNYISDYSLTVSHKGGSLTFEGRDSRKGYFMMPEGVTALNYAFSATSGDGKAISLQGTIENVEPAHEYVLNIKASESGDDGGGAAFIAIDVDDTMVVVNDEVTITVPPAIIGDGFDIALPVAGESGLIGGRNVYVSAATPLASIAITNAPGIADFDLLTADDALLGEVKRKGISGEVQDVDGGQLVKIMFADSYINALENSDAPYIIGISATDGRGKNSSASLTLRISEAPVTTHNPAKETISYTSAVLQGQIMKDVETAGFQYRAKGSSDWTYVAGSTSRAGLEKGQTYYATVRNLAVAASYEYRAVSGPASNPVEYQADIVEFTTNNGPQLPNAGMEDWHTANKVVLPQANGGTEFWDSGNHGSSTMSVTLTNQTTEKVHGGEYGAKLRSQFVGIGSIGKFAAGNLFTGKYLATEGTDGLIGFGRPFDIPRELKLTKLRVWMHYTPGVVEKKGAKDSYLSQGEMDKGEIYIALFDDFDNYLSEYANSYGCIVRTKGAEKLFNKDAGNVVAHGTYHLEAATSGNDLVMIEIPLEYKSGKGAPKLIDIVCSASIYGDYFCGGEGSTLYVDDFELIYEPI